MFPLLQSLLKYGPQAVEMFMSTIKEEEKVGECCCCKKSIGVGLKNAKFDLIDNQIVLCCDDPVCNAFLKIRALGSEDVYF